MAYKYNSADLARPIELSEREEFLLKDSKTFCIYPWIHLHAYPTGEAYPCCHAEMAYPVGNARFKTLEAIYRDAPMRELRKDMLNEQPNPACGRCYEQEESGFFSGRKSGLYHIDMARNSAFKRPRDTIEWSGQDVMSKFDPYKVRLAIAMLDVIRVWPYALHGFVKKRRITLRNFMNGPFVEHGMTVCVLGNTVVLCLDYYGAS